jgi:hypothetical protein
MVTDKIKSSEFVLADLESIIPINEHGSFLYMINIIAKAIVDDSRFIPYCSVNSAEKLLEIISTLESYSKTCNELTNRFRVNLLQTTYQSKLGDEIRSTIQEVYRETIKKHEEVLLRKEIIKLINGKTLIENLSIETHDLPPTELLIAKGTTLTKDIIESIDLSRRGRITGYAFDKKTSQKFYDLIKWTKVEENKEETFGLINGTKLHSDIHDKLQKKFESKSLEKIEVEVGQDISLLLGLYIDVFTFLNDSKAEIYSLSTEVLEVICNLEKSYTVVSMRGEVKELMELLNDGDDFDDYFSEGKVFRKFHSKISKEISCLIDYISSNPTKHIEKKFTAYF